MTGAADEDGGDGTATVAEAVAAGVDADGSVDAEDVAGDDKGADEGAGAASTVPNRVSAILPAAAIAALSVAAFLTACQPAPVANAAGENASDQGPLPPPLPLGVPILALMLGPIGDASDDVFLTAMSPTGLSDDDWMRVGSAAVDLVANASAITLSGPGPKDMEWVRDPAWQQRARDVQHLLDVDDLLQV